MDQSTFKQIDLIFNPSSVAVIGASDVYEKWGYQVLAAAKESSAGTGRRIYAVNSGASEVQREKCYPGVLDIPGPVDVVVITVPAAFVPRVMEDCVRKGVRGAIVITGDFAEASPEGAARQAEVLSIARRGGIRMVGPNIMGNMNTSARLVTTPFIHDYYKGKIAFAAQSGNVGVQVLQYGYNDAVGFSKFVGTGNEADLTLEDFVEYFAADPETSVIALYIEGLKNGRRFLDLARQVTPKKPIVVIKSGRTDAGGRAARSHSSALAGADIIYETAFRQCGVVRTGWVLELLYVASALCRQPIPKGNRVGIIVFGGGIGVLAADECRRLGLEIPALKPETVARLNKVMPSFWSRGNPVDTIGLGNVVIESIHALLDDENIDNVLCVSTPGLMQILPKRLSHLPPALREETVARLNLGVEKAYRELDGVIEHMDRVNKPVVFCKTNPSEEKLNPRIFSKLQEQGFTVCRTSELGASVISGLYRYGAYLRGLK